MVQPSLCALGMHKSCLQKETTADRASSHFPVASPTPIWSYLPCVPHSAAPSSAEIDNQFSSPLLLSLATARTQPPVTVIRHRSSRHWSHGLWCVLTILNNVRVLLRKETWNAVSTSVVIGQNNLFQTGSPMRGTKCPSHPHSAPSPSHTPYGKDRP